MNIINYYKDKYIPVSYLNLTKEQKILTVTIILKNYKLLDKIQNHEYFVYYLKNKVYLFTSIKTIILKEILPLNQILITFIIKDDYLLKEL